MRNVLLLLVFFVIGEASLSGQNKVIDSLRIKILHDGFDTTRVNDYLTMSNALRRSGNFNTGIKYSDSALKLSARLNFRKGVAQAFNNIGGIYQEQGDYDSAIANHLKAAKIKKELGDKKGVAASYNNLGYVYGSLGNYAQALDYHFKSLEIKGEIRDSLGIAYSYNNIALIYKKEKNYKLAFDYQGKSLKAFQELHYKRGIAACYLNIGILYYDNGNNVAALENYRSALEIYEQIKEKPGLANCYNNIGNIYADQADSALILHDNAVAREKYDRALGYYLKSLQVKEEIGFKGEIVTSYLNLASVYKKLDRYKEAIEYGQKALDLALSIKNKEVTRDSYKELSDVYFLHQDYKQAYENYQLFALYKDSLLNIDTLNRISALQGAFDVKKKEIEMKTEQEKKNIAAAAEMLRQKRSGLLLRNSLVVMVIFLFVFAFLFVKEKTLRSRIAFAATEVVASAQKITSNYEALRNMNKGLIDYLASNKLIFQKIEAEIRSFSTFLNNNLELIDSFVKSGDYKNTNPVKKRIQKYFLLMQRKMETEYQFADVKNEEAMEKFEFKLEQYTFLAETKSKKFDPVKNWLIGVSVFHFISYGVIVILTLECDPATLSKWSNMINGFYILLESSGALLIYLWTRKREEKP